VSDRFRPISMEQLTDWVFTELEARGAVFGAPQSAFFAPSPEHRFRVEAFGRELDTPFGVAAGPHTQMAQNIIVAWLAGARVIELKTVQALDELQVNKPCIDVEDEGYNVEWSQELKVHQSFDEYLRAWVLIHALHDALGLAGVGPGMVFNMSVGYDFESIMRPNVQWFLDAMRDASDHLPAYIDIVAERRPEARGLWVPAEISDTVTLSTMHGCPPGEIERIARYLLEERELHTSVKCNPTLLGADRVRAILNDDLGYHDVAVPDEAFEHDLSYADAAPMFHNLRRVASERGRVFGLKLSNTLEVENRRAVFDRDEVMYMSGRALHAVTANLALLVAEDHRGGLPLSFAGGADAFNIADLLRCGVETVTVCSDLLKSGGYLRMLQYVENLDAAMSAVGAVDIADFACKSAVAGGDLAEFPAVLRRSALTDSGLSLGLGACSALAEALAEAPRERRAVDVVRDWARGAGYDDSRADEAAGLAVEALARLNLRGYADDVRADWRYMKRSFHTGRSKTARELGPFDCIEAPCRDECPVDQDVPGYMRAVRDGDFDEAVRITRRDNPLPSILGRVCDHLCEDTCIRTHFDQPLAIRSIKRFIMGREAGPRALAPERAGGVKTASLEAGPAVKAAIVGAGPAGLAAALELGRAGLAVTVFEARPYPGGMVGGAIPAYRLPQEQIDRDTAALDELGVEVRYGATAGADFTLDELRSDGHVAVVVAVGAQLPKRLNLEGEDCDGVIDALSFLRGVREGSPPPVGARVGVIGAGDTAMDCARSALRLGAEEVSIIYRRTVDQAPADREEIGACVEEGVGFVELTQPVGLRVEGGRLAALTCVRTVRGGDRGSSGGKAPAAAEDSEFEIPLDTLIPAISQHAVLDFFGDDSPALTPRGYIEVDPVTLESSVPGVYAVGDAAGDGPSSIVRAAADGKRAAAAIIAKHGVEVIGARAPPRPPEAGLHELVVRRSRREYRAPMAHTPLEERGGFEETALGYTEEQAMAEAGRCLDCDLICSLCVGVCPNMALMTYEAAPGRFVAQRFQIAVLADFCNECGNCVTACPTSGVPFRDKPRLHLSREGFEAEEANAFMLGADGAIEARVGGETHRLSVDGVVDYSTPSVAVKLDPETLAVIKTASGQASAGEAALGEAISLEPAAVMFKLREGLLASMPHLPSPRPEGAAATFIPPPSGVSHM